MRGRGGPQRGGGGRGKLFLKSAIDTRITNHMGESFNV